MRDVLYILSAEREEERVFDAHTVPTTSMDGLSSFDRTLEDGDRLKLHSHRIARSNPFSKLKRANTQKALQEMSALTESTAKLPVLAQWLQKKKSSYSWQKRSSFSLPWYEY